MNKILLQKTQDNIVLKEFSEKFIKDSTVKKYLFGRNIYANKIVAQVDIDGFIDDYYTDKVYLGKQVIKLEEVPKNSFVLVLSGGNTQSALKKVREVGLECLDYYSFYHHANIELTEVCMNENFRQEYDANSEKFENIYTMLEDEESKNIFYQIVNFRYSYDLKYLKGFKNSEDKQYFEDFLKLEPGEIFVDVGGYDGYTTEEFIRLCPNYNAVHIFEPEYKNLQEIKKRLKGCQNIHLYGIGLSNKKDTLQFDSSGSASKISDNGDVEIKVDKLDDILKENFTFIKMDIEGAEEYAIEGAVQSIKRNHPKLAISVYHKVNDLWKIPEKILSIRDDYKIYLRHYTESIYETVMFFIPIERDN